MTNEPEGDSRVTKHRTTLRSIGLIRLDVWVPAASVQSIRDLEEECSRDVLEAARQAGLLSEPKPGLTAAQQNAIVALVKSGKSMSEVARVFGVHRSTVVRIIGKKKKSG